MNRTGIYARTAALGVLSLLLGACATPIKSTVDQASDTDFSSFGTYAWISDEPYVSANVDSALASALNQQRVRAGIESELESKGYRKADVSEADIVLGFTLGTRDRVRVRNYYDSFGFGFPSRFNRFGGFNRFGSFNRFGGYSRFGRFSGFGPGVTFAQSVRTITEGTLAVDVFDNHSNEAIWHGMATKSLSGDPNGQQLIAEAVAALFGPLPDSMIATAQIDDTA